MSNEVLAGWTAGQIIGTPLGLWLGWKLHGWIKRRPSTYERAAEILAELPSERPPAD